MGRVLAGLVYAVVVAALMSLVTSEPAAIVAAPLLPVVGVASACLVADVLEEMG
jgi:hypothetical protein